MTPSDNPPKAEDNPVQPPPKPAQPTPQQDKNPVPGAKQNGAGEGSSPVAAAPCCCQDITLKLDKVTVTTLTDAGDLPGFSGLLGRLTADHVFVFATDCKGNVAKYPDDSHGIKLDAGESDSPHKVLATITPDANCYVDCVVKVEVRKGSDLNSIIDAITSINKAIQKAAGDLAKDTQTLQSLLAKAAPQAAIAAAIGAVASDQDVLNTLNAQLAELLKLLAGTADTLMDEISFQFKGSLACSASMVSVIRESGDWKQDAGDNTRATLDVSISHLGGVWNLSFVAFKDCPRR